MSACLLLGRNWAVSFWGEEIVSFRIVDDNLCMVPGIKIQERGIYMSESKRGVRARRNSDFGIAAAFLFPAFAMIIVVTIIPIILAIRTSFHATSYAQVGKFVGIQNYISVFKENGILNIFNSVRYVLLSLLVVIPLGIMIGTLLNRKFKGNTLLRTLIIIPWVLSQTVTALLWKWLLNGSYGPITYLMYQMTGSKVDFFSSSTGSNIMLVLANAWNTVPVVIILTIAALQTVSPEMTEAAQIDGANGWQVYTRITLPTIRPTIITAIVMQSMEYFNMVTLIYTLTAGGPFNSTQTLSLAAYQNAFNYWHMDIASAYGVIIFLLNILFSMFYIKLLRSNND